MDEREPVLFCWSGGKDSAMALHAVTQDPRVRVVALLTTVTEGYDRISMHGVRRELLQQQARSIGLTLHEVFIPPECPNSIYEARMEAALCVHFEKGIRKVAFGDIFLEDLRAYREKNLARVGMTALFPIWKRDSRELIDSFHALGFRSIAVCVNPKFLDRSFAGRQLDRSFFADLPPQVDCCGENGEFHTFAFDGPIFKEPVRFVVGERVERDSFVFCDLVMEKKCQTYEPHAVKHEETIFRTILILAIILFAAIIRIVPHPWNLAPVGAMALFSGAVIRNRVMAFVFPVLAMLAGDFFIGFHKLMPVVYASFLISTVIGFWLRERRSVARLGGAVLLGAIQFFLITNFGVWMFLNTYPKTFAGLSACYAAGVPFFWNTLAGDICYAALLFGGLFFAERSSPVLRPNVSAIS